MKGGGVHIGICSDEQSWINTYVPELLLELLSLGHTVETVTNAEKLKGGDFCFYLSYSKIVSCEIRSKFKHNLVIHESDLPSGKGWSPLTWQILEGKNEIPITLIEADDKVDSGPIYLQKTMKFNGSELIDELRRVQAKASIQLVLEFISLYQSGQLKPKKQLGNESFYDRRNPLMSQLDIHKTIHEQFNHLRTVDNDTYPAYFELHGRIYFLKISGDG